MLIKLDAAISVVTRPVFVFYQKSPHIEHMGFVMLATTEVFHLGPFVFFVNLILMVSGALAVAYETVGVRWRTPEDDQPKLKGKANGRRTQVAAGADRGRPNRPSPRPLRR